MKINRANLMRTPGYSTGAKANRGTPGKLQITFGEVRETKTGAAMIDEPSGAEPRHGIGSRERRAGRNRVG